MSEKREEREESRRSRARSNRRSDERRPPTSRHDGPPPESLSSLFGGGGGGGRRDMGPQRFSGTAFTDTELLNEIPKKKFTGRCRLFIGNIPPDLKEAELKELFTPHGDISECFLSGKGFAFLRLDSRAHAESAKEALDGKNIKGRQIRVRYAVHGATIKVKELSPVVSNEMLHLTFSAFGDVERAVHIVDEKGKPTGEGIIEFERKAAAVEAVQQINDRVFLMTANSRPLIASFLDPKDEEDGLSEKMLQKTIQLVRERELGPRFAAMNSFEYVYGRRWKELYEYEAKRRVELEAELREQRRRLDADMELAYEDYKADLLREELQRRQEELERLESSRQRREQQRAQIMGGGAPWMPPLFDGPVGRPPPTFGPQRTPGLGPPFGGMERGPMDRGGMDRGPMDRGGMDRGPMDRGGMDRNGPPPSMGMPPRMQNGHGPGEGGGPPQQSGPDVMKLLQAFDDSPIRPAQGGGPPPPNGPLDNKPSPLSAFMGMVNPLMANPGGQRLGGPNGGGGLGGRTPSGPGGSRIPPPPLPLGAAPPPNAMMDFPPPPDKRSRRN